MNAEWLLVGVVIGILIGIILWLLISMLRGNREQASVIFERDESGKIIGIHYASTKIA